MRQKYQFFFSELLNNQWFYRIYAYDDFPVKDKQQWHQVVIFIFQNDNGNDIIYDLCHHMSMIQTLSPCPPISIYKKEQQ